MRIRYTKSDPAERPLGMQAEATVELEGAEYGPLSGSAITGFGIWEPSEAGGRPTVTLPARVYHPAEDASDTSSSSPPTRTARRNHSGTPSPRAGWRSARSRAR